MGERGVVEGQRTGCVVYVGYSTVFNDDHPIDEVRQIEEAVLQNDDGLSLAFQLG